MLYLLAGVAFILMLGLLVLVHEAGHFFVAKAAGVKVEEFGIGFPPRALSRRIGETEFSLNWIPFGGYVRMLGQDDFHPDQTSDDPRSFERASPLWRIAISLAGVTMNLLLAVLLLWGGYMIGMPSFIRAGERAVIHQILPDRPASESGLLAGDRITAIEGIEITSSGGVAEALLPLAGKRTSIQVERGTEQILLPITPDEGGKIGIELSTELVRPYLKGGPLTALGYALQDVQKGTVMTLAGLRDLGVTLVTRFRLTEEVGGPVRIAQATYYAVKVGWDMLLQLAALLSLSLALLNILPIPALDGGHVLFTLIEILRGKPLSKRLQQTILSIGMGALLLLIAATIIQDVVLLFH